MIGFDALAKLRLLVLHGGEVLCEGVDLGLELLAVELVRAGVLGSFVDLAVFQEHALKVGVLLEVAEIVGERGVVFGGVEGLDAGLEQAETTLVGGYLVLLEHIAAHAHPIILIL